MKIQPARDEGLSSFLARLKSGDPTPGGGAVAALCGALSAALVAMVGNLSIGKKKYAEAESAFMTSGAQLDRLIHRLEALMEDDAVAFEGWMAAARLPKTSEDEKALRQAAMATATLEACRVPMEILRACAELPRLIREAAERGNAHAISDAGIAGLLCDTAARAAAMNVRINLAGLAPGARAPLAAELDRLLPTACDEARAVAEMVERRLAAAAE